MNYVLSGLKYLKGQIDTDTYSRWAVLQNNFQIRSGGSVQSSQHMNSKQAQSSLFAFCSRTIHAARDATCVQTRVHG